MKWQYLWYPLPQKNFMDTKFPAFVMVLAVVSNEGHVVTTTSHIRVFGWMLLAMLRCWIDLICDWRPYLFQQDSASATKPWWSKIRSRSICISYDHIIPNIWTLNLPSRNPLDYYIMTRGWTRDLINVPTIRLISWKLQLPE